MKHCLLPLLLALCTSSSWAQSADPTHKPRIPADLRQRLVERFDANGDGRLDVSERSLVRKALAERSGKKPGKRSGADALPNGGARAQGAEESVRDRRRGGADTRDERYRGQRSTPPGEWRSGQRRELRERAFGAQRMLRTGRQRVDRTEDGRIDRSERPVRRAYAGRFRSEAQPTHPLVRHRLRQFERTLEAPQTVSGRRGAFRAWPHSRARAATRPGARIEDRRADRGE